MGVKGKKKIKTRVLVNPHSRVWLSFQVSLGIFAKEGMELASHSQVKL